MSVLFDQCVTTQDHQRIAFDHYQNSHEKVVIIAHGFYNSKQALLMKELAEALSSGYDVMVMDFRGHGKSEGFFHWTSREYLDLIAVIERARQQYKRVGVIGFSLGAATSIITASKTDQIDTLIAVSPPADFNKIEYHFWELDAENDIMYSLFKEGRIGKGVRPGPFWLWKEKPILKAREIKCPVFYIHGEADWLIKPWHSEKLYKTTMTRRRLAIIKNGPHAEYLMRKNKDEFMGLVLDWLRETL